MHAFRSYIFAARIACDSGPTCYITTIIIIIVNVQILYKYKVRVESTLHNNELSAPNQRYEGHPINKLQNGIILLIFQNIKKSEI